MKDGINRILEGIKDFLAEIQFPERRNTRQTAICVFALLDKNPRKGLLQDKRCLNDGARIHDILEFARKELGIHVAENTRESYRKQSLKILLDSKLITRHSTAVNDPNTFYVLNKIFENFLRNYLKEENGQRKQQIVGKWNATARRFGKIPTTAPTKRLVVKAEGEDIQLSPGNHNLLITAIVNVFAPIFIDSPKVLLISDAEHKLKYVNPLTKRLGLKIDKHKKLPDLIFYSTTRNIVYLNEAVTSAGPIDEARIRDIDTAVLPEKKTFGIEFFTAFPDRKTFKRFIEDIAWGTQVWLANEPFGVIIFHKVK